jgi:hypothetical protein
MTVGAPPEYQTAPINERLRQLAAGTTTTDRVRGGLTRAPNRRTT